MATRDEIVSFLTLVHSAPPPIIVGTVKNRETRWRLGITVMDQMTIVRNLTADDYVSGPEPNRDHRSPGDVWIFKRFEFGTTFYVKLQLDNARGHMELRLVAISCHIDNI